MIVFDHTLHEKYLQGDPILRLLNEATGPNDAALTSHRWLLESSPKRMIYFYMYGDLLQATPRLQRVLDVGGGYSALSRLILRSHAYTLLDIMVHDRSEDVRALEASIGRPFWVNSDWHQFIPPSDYDLIIANDLFPNVDQRLVLFLEAYLPRCREMRLLLTYYNHPRFYQVKRLDADEVLCMLAWDGQQVKLALTQYANRIEQPDCEILLRTVPSLFSNKRQVCMVRLRGDLHE